MREVLFQYYVDPTTWVYLSCLMTIGIYFKFRRFWCVRNLDLIGVLAFGPGMLLIASPTTANMGYIWLFVVGGFFLCRMLIDPLMIRRPLLEPNLSLDGLTFTGFALFFFLIANAVTCKLIESDNQGAQRMDMILSRQLSADELAELPGHGPGWPVFQVFSTFSNTAFVADEMAAEETPPLPTSGAGSCYRDTWQCDPGPPGNRDRAGRDRVSALRKSAHRHGCWSTVLAIAL